MSEHFHFLVSSFLFASIVTWIAWRAGFMRLGGPPLGPRLPPTLREVGVGFLLFLAIELLLVPAFAGLLIALKAGKVLKPEEVQLGPLALGWFNVAAIVASSLGLVGYSWLLPKVRRRALYWGEAPHRPLRDLLAGAATWLISYPWVVVFSHLLALLFLLFGPLPQADQVAVKQLKLSQGDVALFWSTVLSIIFLVPLAEELLFRGLLQRSLIPYFGRWRAIALSSALFALFHFSASQGWNNLELVLSLFILSCYLGFIYEKRGSLWAPVGLHMAFNMVSVALILLQEKALV
jgi:CAAX protease family protein